MAEPLLPRLSWRLRNLTAHRPKRPAPNLDKGPVVVAGMFRTPNGLCQSALGCLDALGRTGWSPLAVDTSEILNQAEAEPVTALSRMPQTRSGTVILHANAPETEILLFKLGLRRWHKWRVIGYWAWELPDLPDAWVPVQRHVHEIWTPSDFCTNAMSTRLDVPVSTVPHPVSAPEAVADQPVGPSSAMKCLIMADGRSSFDRKNLFASVELFRRAFVDREDATLLVRCRHLDAYPEAGRRLAAMIDDDPRIRLQTGSSSRDAVWEMLADCDILLSCHRSEGFGLHLAEAMALGKLVVATGWSGNLQFMTEENSLLLPYSLVRVQDRFGVYESVQAHWAEVDLDGAADMLRNLIDDQQRVAAIGARAKADIAWHLQGLEYAKAMASEPRPAAG